ncbi:MAG: DUF6491 family protein [Steroidobacteraceae bacterium]
MPALTRLMISITALGLMAGCVAPPPSKADVALEANLLKYAGPPIDSFTYLGSYDDFRTLGNNVVLVVTTLSDAYLIRVREPCYGLQVANRVALTSELNTVNRTFDKVIVRQQRCGIDTIRRIDYSAYKRDRFKGA